ncbi:MAG: type III-A CRISPR-associated RAMP protein Csm4 [Bacteroidia bacterium]|nr:type III-A CRISPR-associated RAMP protein Csm4 [Bacteroidia bacterium]
MDLILFACKGNHQFHFGQVNLEDSFDHIQSDTLFSALVNCFAMLYPEQQEIENLLQAFASGKLSISSAFPCMEFLGAEDQLANPARPNIEDYIFFLPKPIVYNRPRGEDVKQIKRIRYISSELWKRAPEPSSLASYEILGGRMAISKEESERFHFPTNLLGKTEIRPISDDIVPKVRVHADSQDNDFYHQAVVQLNLVNYKREEHNKIYTFQAQTHYYFLLKEELSEDLKGKFKAALFLLGDEGIGGERSTGKGHPEEIRWYENVDHLFEFGEPESYANLSLLIPDGEGEFDQVEEYELTIRAGGSLGKYQKSEWHRQQIRMIREGAWLRSKLKGKQVDLRPQNAIGQNRYPHPVYRNGHCFPLGFNFKEENES